MVRFEVLAISIVICLALCCLIAACLSTQQTQKGTTPHSVTIAPSNMDEGTLSSSQVENNTSTHQIKNTNSGKNLSIISGSGTIIYQDLEGGFYSIMGDDGKQYLPASLAQDLKINGTRIWYSVLPTPDSVSMYMAGTSVDILSIEPITKTDSANKSESLIEYEKAGGIAGSYEILRIYEDQQGEVTKWNQDQQMNISDEEMKNLTLLFNKTEFSSLKSQYLPKNIPPNAMTYTIRYGNRSVKATQEEMPEPLKPVVLLLNKILEKHTISPITANKTLEGTAWRLSSYLRSDGITIVIQNSTQVSAIFGKDGIITGSSGCNSYSGSFNQSGNNLTFNQIVVTRMACLDQGTMEIETMFLKLLGRVNLVNGQERTLVMADVNNTTLLTFNLMKG